MRRSAAPSVLAKKLQGQGKENVAEAKLSDEAGGVEPRRNFLSVRKKFKTPVASLGLVDSSGAKSGREEVAGGLQRSESNVGKDAPVAGRNSSEVLDLINAGRVGTVGTKSASVSDSSGNLSTQCGKSLSASVPDVVPDILGESERDGDNLDLPSVANLKSSPGRPLLSGSSSTRGVKRNCPDEGGLVNEKRVLRKRHLPITKQGVSRTEEEVECIKEVPAISKVDNVNEGRSSADSEHLNVDSTRLGGAEKADLNVLLESTSSEGKEEQPVNAKEEDDNKVVALDSKITKSGNMLHGPQSQRASLHRGVKLKEASRPTQEVGLADYYSVMYCPRKKNAKRKGPWSDGIIVCQGRSCTLQDMDGKAVTKANLQGLKDMPEGATLDVGKFEVEVMRKASSEEVLSGALYLANKAPQPIPTQLPALTMKKQTFKSVKPGGSQQSSRRDKGPFFTQMDALKLNGDLATEVPVVVDPYIASKLRPHQKDGVKFMYECIMGLKSKSYCGCLLADEMGLGKTLQVITLLWTILKQGPAGTPAVKRALVVCPSSLVQNWGNEVQKWLGRERLRFMAVHAGTTHREAAHKFADFRNGQVSPLLITSYEILRKHIDVIASAKPGLLVCDEAHRLKNCAGNKTIDALVGLQCPRKILLTGTPVQNDLNEFYAMIDFANPGLLGPLSAFKRIFAEPIEFSQDRTASLEEQKLGKARSLELQSRTEFCILRRTADINKQYLPTKTELFVFCRLQPLQLAFYRIITSKALRSLHLCDNASATILSSITSLRKLCSHPQLTYNDIFEETNLDPELLSQINDAGLSKLGGGADDTEVLQARVTLSNEGWNVSGKLSCLYWLLLTVYSGSSARPKDRVVVVSNFTRTLDLIQDMCTSQGWKWLRLDGSTEASKRQPLVDQLNSGFGEVFVFLLSSKAGGTGLNLIGANRLVLFDPDWNPATDSQAIARIWREGQLKPVMIYRLLSTGSIEEKIYQRQIMKGGMSAAVEGDIDGHTKKSSIGRHFSKEELRELFTLNLETKCDTFDLISRTKTAPGKTWMDHSNDVDDPALQSAIASGIVSFVYNDRDPDVVPHPLNAPHPVDRDLDDLSDYEQLLA
ncbi:hypothetical protein KC19_1G051700 [Ceratodon purpureus]|uniref:Uncharacterized protein n=1 Tax=Ceratodon purpureus TaxID=3225 RepID=A0A8T0J1N8_CERPU|nr:hypothetical protein KC19_1G051700 [Ceratodon purpureus]